MTNRLFWFFIGGAAVTWWTNRRQNTIEHPFCKTSSIHERASSSNSPPDLSAHRPGGLGYDFPRYGTPGWDAEKQKLQEISAKAGETMSEFSEATLDTLLVNLQGLKTRLAEARANREKERATRTRDRMVSTDN